MNEMSFTLKTEYIELQKLLKVMNLIASGGEVRDYLADHAVDLNGEPENRRGRKIRAGDVVEIDGKISISVS